MTTTTNQYPDAFLWVDRAKAHQRVYELTSRVGISDLTTLEMLALIAFLEQADELSTDTPPRCCNWFRSHLAAGGPKRNQSPWSASE